MAWLSIFYTHAHHLSNNIYLKRFNGVLYKHVLSMWEYVFDIFKTFFFLPPPHHSPFTTNCLLGGVCAIQYVKNSEHTYGNLTELLTLKRANVWCSFWSNFLLIGISSFERARFVFEHKTIFNKRESSGLKSQRQLKRIWFRVLPVVTTLCFLLSEMCNGLRNIIR